VVCKVAVIIRVPVHHAGDAQNIVGRIAAIARWWATCTGMPLEWCCRKLRLLRAWLPLAAAMVAWCRKLSDSSMYTPRYLICGVAAMVLLLILRGGCALRLLFLSLLVRGRQ